jgi:adenylate kinase family enzyme
MKRIIIIGSGGAGKSTLAKRLGEISNLPVLHLDKLYWQPNWQEPNKTDWENKVSELLKKKCV